MKVDPKRYAGGGACAVPEAQDRGCTEIAQQLDQERPKRRQHAHDAAATLQTALSDAGIPAKLSVRLKSPCSTQDKMLRHGVTLSDLHDLCGIRVLVDNLTDCYAALETAHRVWSHIPESLDDYIASPKANGYQSLHTAVRMPCGHTLEIQIRTHEQHRCAETGTAAHWRYKRANSWRLA